MATLYRSRSLASITNYYLLTLDISIRIVPPESIIGRVELISCTGSIHLKILIMIICLILMSVHTHLVAIATEGNGGIQSDLAILLVIDGTDFESILVTTNESRLLTSIAGGAGTHYRGLGEDAGAAVGVRSIFGIDGGKLCV
jgi:hypothetical protein